MTIDPALLRESLELAARGETGITRRFYEILFQRYPHLRALFGRNEPRAQEEMLQSALLLAVDNLDDPEWLAENIGGLGARHVDYGVTDEMYAMVGECLIRALAELCGDAWTEAHEDSWVDAYVALADLALEGADRYRAQREAS